MDSRERVFLSLSHEEPDRTPVDLWTSGGVRQSLEREFGMDYSRILDAYDIDLRYITGPAYVGPRLEGDDGATDIWGVPRRSVTVRGPSGIDRYSEVTRPPLADAATVEDVEEYAHWPSLDWFDYGVVARQCRHIRDEGRVVVFMGDRLNRVAQLKPAMYLRGVEAILLDMAMNPEVARAIFGRIRDFYLAYLGRILDAADGGIDIVLTGDDFGTQQGLMVSPVMWDEFLRGGFTEYVRLIKSCGARAMHHTCGSVVELVPRFLDCGLDVLQSLQPEARGMGAAAFKEAYGDRLCFHGGLSIQQTMPHGSPEAIGVEVRRLAETLGRGGGYILCTAHNIQVDAPMANIRALLEAYRNL